MKDEKKVLKAICDAVDVTNEGLSDKEKILKSIDTNLYGKDGNLDSIALVNLIVAVEEAIADEFGVAITLADEKAMSQSESPFKSLRSLSDYILLLLNEKEQKIK
jgi:acyl carrier protein